MSKKYYLDKSVDGENWGRSGTFKLSDLNIFDVTFAKYCRIYPVKSKKVYEYKYLYTLDGFNWLESTNYFTSKKAFIDVEEIPECQRLTHTKRVRK